MKKSNIKLEVLVNGRVVTEYNDNTRSINRKQYIEGRKGTQYSIRITNLTNGRIVAIPSVDGLSVMDGQPASYDSQGYVINAYDNLVIDGWRISDDKVRSFFFSDSKNSYSNKSSGETDNLGVIGVAVFKEKQKPTIRYNDVWRKNTDWDWERPRLIGSTLNATANNVRRITDGETPTFYGSTMFDTAQCSASYTCDSFEIKNTDEPLGTGMGNEVDSKVYSVNFDRASATPYVIIELHYRTMKTLERLGVVKENKDVRPSSFPAETKYCRQV